MRTFLAALLGLLLIASPAPAQTVSFQTGTLGASGDAVSIQLFGQQGVSVSLPAGLVGTVTPQFSFDGGSTYWSDLANPPFILPLATNSASGTLAVPSGATNAQVTVSAYTSGSTTATLRVMPSAADVGPHRAHSSGALSAATATVITGGAAQSVTGNFVAIPVNPTKWATAVFTFTASAFNGTLTWDVMINGQWYATGLIAATQPVVGAPYATLTSTAAGSPSTAGQIVYTTTAADTWEMPLPANATQVRVRCSARTSGSVTVTVSPGKPYVHGTPVVATMWDQTSATNTATDTGIIEVGGWKGLAYEEIVSGGTASIGTWLAGISATPTQQGALRTASGIGGLGLVGGLGVATGSSFYPRVEFKSAAIAAQTTQERVTVYR